MQIRISHAIMNKKIFLTNVDAIMHLPVKERLHVLSEAFTATYLQGKGICRNLSILNRVVFFLSRISIANK